MSRKKWVGDGDSDTQKHTHGELSDTVHATKKSSTPVASDTTVEKGAVDKDKSTTNRNLVQVKERDSVFTDTSYFDPVWNSFSKHTDGSISNDKFSQEGIFPCKTHWRYQISKSLIINGLDNQDQISVWLSNDLIIKPKNPIIKSINIPNKAWYHVLERSDHRTTCKH